MNQSLTTTEMTGKENSFHFNMLSVMEHFTRSIATFFLLLVLFLYSIQCVKMANEWKTLSPDLPHEYIFSNDYNEKRDWYEARRWCKENGGGDLLTIKSQLEARKITTELRKVKSILNAHWTGLQDLNNDGTWAWFDGTEFDLNITKESGIVFHAILVGSPRLCASFRTWSWTLLPGSLNAPSMFLPVYCPRVLSFICKRNNTTLVTQNPSVSSDWKDYLPSDYSRHLPTACPAGFIDLPKKCVRVEHNTTTVLNWQQASSFCRDQYGNQSYLLNFHDDDDVMDLSVHLLPERTEYWTGFWIYRKRKPCWSDNTQVNNISWSTFEEDEQQRRFLRKCGYLVHESQSTRLFAVDCTLKKNFICQINKKATVSSSVNIVTEDFMNVTQCPPGSSFVTTESCYKVVPEKMDYKRAELFCNKQNGSHLTSVESKFEDILLQRIAEYSNVSTVWLGLQLQETPQLLDTGKRLFYWNDGYPVFYDKWLKDQQDNIAVNKSMLCVAHQGATQWVASSCNETYPFICKRKLDQSSQLVNKGRTFCPNHWVLFDSHCYYIERDIELTWREAAEKCIHFNINSTLTGITSDLEVQFVEYIVQGNVQSGVWTGVFLNKYNIPTSIDGTTVRLAGHEHSSKFPGKCGMLTPSDRSENLQWTDCNQKHGYVCKIKQLKQKDFVDTNETSAGCPSNEWVRLDDHCYLFLPDQFSTWTQASQLCSDKSEDLNANLVSIHSLKENHFIQMNLYDRTKLPFHRWSWIGYHADTDTSDSEYVWQWTDKTTLDYQNWKTSIWSPPLKTGGHERLCVAMDTVSGIWATKQCTTLYGAVCKIPFSKAMIDSGPETTSYSLSTLHSPHSVDIFSQDIALEKITTVPQSNNSSAEDQRAENYAQNKEKKSSFPVTSIIITIGISLLILFLIFIIAILLLRDRFPRSLIFCCKRSAADNNNLQENCEYINTDELSNFDDMRL